jgi:DMSO/TMAO reductase YedYZ molybdopterin-dependent catalytic subunit
MKYSIVASAALIVSILGAFVFISGCTTGRAVDNPGSGLPAIQGYSIEITGGTNGPVILSYADIKALGLVRKDKVVHPGSNGLNVTDDYVGVPLLAVIEKAGLPAGAHAYNVTGLDGYSAVYDQTKADNGVIVLKKNGTALADDITDPITLILPGGPFCHWVKYPTKISIVDAGMGEGTMEMSGHDMNMS